MIDINLVRNNFEEVKKNYEKRRNKTLISELKDLRKLDEEWRVNKKKLDELRHQKNNITKEIAQLKKENKDIRQKLVEAIKIPQEIGGLEERVDQLKEKINELLLKLPNLLHPTVPYGKDESENKELEKTGEIKEFNFKVKSHIELAEDLDLVDFDQVAKVTGNGFYYLKNELALMEQALIKFAIDYLVKKGYCLITPPLMLRKRPYEGVTNLTDFEDTLYKIENDDLYLIATSEHPIAALHMNQILDEEKLPLKYIGISPCFRKEIGSHGIDEKGLFRVHQFNKIEQFIFCKPDDSEKLHEELIKNAEEIFKKLKIPFRKVNICTGDLGIVAAKKYDLEAWSSRQKKYIEVVSCSNCTDYQARRLNIQSGKYGGEKSLVHTLNSTAVATTRALVVILENYQQKDGSIKIPLILQSYMNGLKRIGGKK